MGACVVCQTRLTGEQVCDWGMCCSEVCWDSMNAEFQREVEAGKYDDLLAD